MAERYAVLQLSETGIGAEEWNRFVERANGGTIFHRLDFLAYHNSRFSENERHLVIVKGDELFGVMPMAVFEENGRTIAKSPYGASYGGPLFRKKLAYSEATSVTEELLDALRSMRVDKLIMTLPIAPAYDEYCETFRLCLYEHGFQAVNRDISSVTATGETRESTERAFESRARNMTRKALKLGVETIHRADLEMFWPVLSRVYEKHQTLPTHSKEELSRLVRAFPAWVYFDVATHEDRVVAAIGHFVANERMDSFFYLANDPAFQELQALSLLISEALGRARDEQFKYCDFGTSSAKMRGRHNIFRFKESFGTVGCFRDTFAWESNE